MQVNVRNGTTALAIDEDMQSKTSSTVHAIAQIRRKFTTEMEQVFVFAHLLWEFKPSVSVTSCADFNTKL